MENIEYTLEYFIKKFEAIPEKKWTVGTFEDDKGCKCAYGHCGFSDKEIINSTPESTALRILDEETRSTETSIILVNDDKTNARGFGHTPKQRAVNYLKFLRTV